MLRLSGADSVKIFFVVLVLRLSSGEQLHCCLFVQCKAEWENSRLLQPEATQPELDELVRPETKNCFYQYVCVCVCVCGDRVDTSSILEAAITGFGLDWHSSEP